MGAYSFSIGICYLFLLLLFLYFHYAILLVFFLFFRIGSMAIPIKQLGIKLHNEQVELLDSLCGQLRCTNSFFIRQLISHYSTELFERLTDIRLKNESHRLTAFSNKSLLKSIQKPPSNLGLTHSPKPNPNTKTTNK